jgi:hypothetical protein
MTPWPAASPFAHLAVAGASGLPPVSNELASV